MFSRAFPLALLLLSSVPSTPAQACTEPAGFAALRDREVVVFGEYHGTNEIPAFFFDVVCATARASKDIVVVALELPDEFNPVLRQTGTLAPEKLVHQISEDTFWDDYGDGRHSRAMLELIARLVHLAAEKPQVRLVAIARSNIDSDGADFLSAEIRRQGATKSVVLIGNAHARLVAMKDGTRRFAGVLAERHRHDVLALDISAGGGQAWVCLPQCAARNVVPSARSAGIHADGCGPTCAYSGTFHIGALSIAPRVDRH